MIFMIDSSQPFDVCESQLGAPCEQLFTPLTRLDPQRPEARFAMDNGAFSRFSESYFLSMLRKHEPRKHLCRFVAVPDVVSDARRTLEVFSIWSRRSELAGWPLALVCQDGQEHLPIPWSRIAAVFIGGSTIWKMGPHAAACVKAAKALGKWVHIGRVNGPDRYEHFRIMGADSCDGSGVGRYDGHRIRLGERVAQMNLVEIEP